MQSYRTLPLTGITDGYQIKRRLRLNCLGSLFFFIYNALNRKKLTEMLHKPLCASLEREHIKDVIEMPRDFLKSTCASEGLPMWRALPLSQEDIDDFYRLGYTDEFIRWMSYAHNPDSHNLLVSGNITNAAKLGKRVRFHFESNRTYRWLFPETLNDSTCIWTDYSLHVRRPKGANGSAHGEGTFDFMGVGSAIQSRHYDGLVVEDDLVGLKESESPTLMEKSIEYHKLLVGVFESWNPNHEIDELVIGNRWGFDDLNAYLREHEPEFRFESHSAEGGCCVLHRAGASIFPEAFSWERLKKRQTRLGNAKYSCQMLNDPSAPDDAEFKENNLSFFDFIHDAACSTNCVNDGNHSRVCKLRIKHEVKEGGVVLEDIPLRSLNIGMIIDPNHSTVAAAGRCRHAIVVPGVASNGNHYVLESWADIVSFDTFYDKIFEIAQRWGLWKAGLETIGAQVFIKHHLEFLCQTKGYSLRIQDLKAEVNLEDGSIARNKRFRIQSVVAPLSERGQLYVRRTQQSFINEYKTFSMKKSRSKVDQLDAFAYTSEVVERPLDDAYASDLVAANVAGASRLGQAYAHGYGKVFEA